MTHSDDFDFDSAPKPPLPPVEIIIPGRCVYDGCTNPGQWFIGLAHGKPTHICNYHAAKSQGAMK
jgi:hypothetical protein